MSMYILQSLQICLTILFIFKKVSFLNVTAVELVFLSPLVGDLSGIFTYFSMRHLLCHCSSGLLRCLVKAVIVAFRNYLDIYVFMKTL